MKAILLVGTGGFLGSALRYLIYQFIQNKFISAFPFGTLGVNIAGCFAIGLMIASLERGNLPAEWRLFLATGICGGFTTFSAFSGETTTLLRDGNLLHAFLYVAASVLLGIASTFLGIALVKLF